MTPPRSPSSGGTVLGALFLGAVAATAAAAVLTFGANVLFIEIVQTYSYGRPVAGLISVVVGLVAGGVLLFTRPTGPLPPILAAVVALFAGIIGDLSSIAAYAIVFSRGGPLEQMRLYLEALTRMDVVGWVLLLLAPAVAAGLAVLRVINTGKQARQASGPWNGPQPPQPPQPPQLQPPYGQPQHGQAPSGQPQHGQPQYGQAPQGHPQHGQAPYGQAPYGQPAQPYGQPAPPYGPPAQPAQPAPQPYGQAPQPYQPPAAPEAPQGNPEGGSPTPGGAPPPQGRPPE
ncbi:hypothetical protein ACFY4C_40270 [Actinomadura viridis]|uniref:hypothetical protein n=1 Tax=Actinomadura viridis TaxID=58110 RepID=UPI00367F557A